MKSFVLFLVAGVFEIGGGYLVWLWLREQKSVWLGALGFIALALYGVVPVFQPAEEPFGRVYAVYGAVFLVLSVFWGWKIDGKVPDFRDWLGASIAIVGAFVMIWPRAAAV